MPIFICDTGVPSGSLWGQFRYRRGQVAAVRGPAHRYIRPPNQGTFGYIRVHSGTFGYIRGRLGHLWALMRSCLHIAFVPHSPRFLSQAGGSVKVQGGGLGGSFGATTYPFYNTRRGKVLRGEGGGARGGGWRRGGGGEIYQAPCPCFRNLPAALPAALPLLQQPFPCSRASPLGG